MKLSTDCIRQVQPIMSKSETSEAMSFRKGEDFVKTEGHVETDTDLPFPFHANL